VRHLDHEECFIAARMTTSVIAPQTSNDRHIWLRQASFGSTKRFLFPYGRPSAESRAQSVIQISTHESVERSLCSHLDDPPVDQLDVLVFADEPEIDHALELIGRKRTLGSSLKRGL
jgi:hypothetical protein